VTEPLINHTRKLLGTISRTCLRCHGNASIPADCIRASDVIPRTQEASASQRAKHLCHAFIHSAPGQWVRQLNRLIQAAAAASKLRSTHSWRQEVIMTCTKRHAHFRCYTTATTAPHDTQYLYVAIFP